MCLMYSRLLKDRHFSKMFTNNFNTPGWLVKTPFKIVWNISTGRCLKGEGNRRSPLQVMYNIVKHCLHVCCPGACPRWWRWRPRPGQAPAGPRSGHPSGWSLGPGSGPAWRRAWSWGERAWPWRGRWWSLRGWQWSAGQPPCWRSAENNNIIIDRDIYFFTLFFYIHFNSNFQLRLLFKAKGIYKEGLSCSTWFIVLI